MYIRFKLVLIFSVILATGCSSVNYSRTASEMGNLLLAEPSPPSVRSQMAIARYNQILAQAPLKNDERAELLFQRGTYYDSLGLPGLALHDFRMAIQLKPDMAEAYNSLGIHYTQQKDFIQAYESFDSTLDINPDYDFAYLNRGIALYYGGRPELAVRDFGAFLSKDEADPYRVLWAYFAENDRNKAQALLEMSKARKSLDEQNWATILVDLFLGTVSETKLLNSLVLGVSSKQQLTSRLCEAYFYLGKYHSALGNKGIASNYFKLALSTNVYEYVEHRYARMELNLLREKVNIDTMEQ